MLATLGTAFVLVLGLLATYISRQPGGWRIIGLAAFYAGAIGVVVSFTWNVAVGYARDAVYAIATTAIETAEPETKLLLLKALSAAELSEAVRSVQLPFWCLVISMLIAAMGRFIASFEVERVRMEAQRRLAAAKVEREGSAQNHDDHRG